MNVGVRRAAVTVSAVLCIILGLFDLAFLDDLLAFDHTASAVRTAVFAFLAHGAAARTVFVVLDLRARDLLFGCLLRTEAGAAGNPFDEFYKDDDRDGKECQGKDQSYDTCNEITKIRTAASAVPVRVDRIRIRTAV